MPDPGPAEYLLDIFFDVGPVLYTPMGEAPFGYDQLEAWQRCHGVRLTPWEARTLRDMSLAYAGEKALAADPGAAAPGSAHETDEQAVERRARVSKSLAQQLRAFRRAS
nr:hypothetical protein H9T68_11680 [Delftia sp. PS-11]